MVKKVTHFIGVNESELQSSWFQIIWGKSLEENQAVTCCQGLEKAGQQQDPCASSQRP